MPVPFCALVIDYSWASGFQITELTLYLKVSQGALLALYGAAFYELLEEQGGGT